MRISDWSSDVCSSDLIPSHVKRVIVFGQRNKAAKICLKRAGVHLSGNGRRVEEWLPSEHDDWNDALRDRLARNAVPRTVIQDRKSVVSGRSVSRVDLGGRRIMKKKKKKHTNI